MKLRSLRTLVLALCAVPFAAPSPSHAQSCPAPPVYCEGWARDSSQRVVSLTQTRECDAACPGTCVPSPIQALPSIRVSTFDHIVLGFSVSNACQLACVGVEPCYNLGVSFRRSVNGSTEAASAPVDCDTEFLYTAAGFNATYADGGADVVNVSNVIYGDCGGPPLSLDLDGAGTSLAIHSHFSLDWVNDVVVGYTEVRNYVTLAGSSPVTITVSNIDYGAKSYTVTVTGAETPTRSTTWGRVRVLYR